jgi:hypothetical protein
MVGTHLDDDRHDTSWHRFVTRARTAIARWNEMRRLDASEVEAIARDLNLSASELSALELSAPTSLEPLNLRLANAGMNESELAATDCGVLRDLQRVCSQCAAKARCAVDLERGRRASPSKYCPNEQTLGALACQARATAWLGCSASPPRGLDLDQSLRATHVFS